MSGFNSNTTNRAANYQSSQSLPKRYQSPSQGPSHYFLSSAKTTGSHSKAVSQSVQQLQQSLQPTNLSLSSSTQQQQISYQAGISSSSQQIQQTSQPSSQHQQYPSSYEGNFISPPSSANQSSKPLFLKNAHSTNSLSMSNPLQQQQQLLLQQQQSRLKMTKHKSSQGNPTMSNNNNVSGSSSSGAGQSATLKQSIKATLMQSQSSQRMGMHQGDYQQKTTNTNNGVLPYPPSSARVKTDYSQEKKPSNYTNNQDPFLSPGAYSSFSSYKSQSLVGQPTQQHGHSSHLFTSPLTDKQQLLFKNTGNSSSSSISTHNNNNNNNNNPLNNRQEISTAASSLTGYRQQQPQQSQQKTAKKQKSQQISQLLKTESNASDFSPTNLTVFIHCKGHRIGPISLGTAGKNVEWLTKQLVNEIIMYEQFQMPENDGQTGLETENILHFQSYQHKNISLSYYLTLKDRPLDPLFHKSLILEPFYSESTETLDGSAEKQVSLMHFHFIKCVGMGGFSRVYLVQKKDTGKMYALKLIEKKFIQTNKKEVIVQNERNIMTIMQGHPFLLQLDYAFESKNYIAFAMEYCAGGEMFYHLRKIKKMTEEQARFYFIEICLGIDFLHERHIIYRDIKPENILLDIDGHIRIGDFGLSKPDMDENEFAYSFCGSPEYMAPEMLLKVGHAYPVDHYTLGALLYELVTGLPPFYSQITEEIYKSILSEELTFPDHADISNELKHLLHGLLTKHPLQRLGQISGTKEILNHPWCRKISINDIVFKKIDPPMKIDVIGFNFDEEEFAKGESEFKAKLMTSYYVQQNEFTPMFPDFYYESPSVKSATAQLNKQLADEQRLNKQKEMQLQQSQKKQQQQQQYPQSLSPNKGQNLLMNGNNTSNGIGAPITGNSDQASQYSQNGSYGGSVRVSQSNLANPEMQLVSQNDKQSTNKQQSSSIPQPLQILNSTPAQQQQQQQQNPSQSTVPNRTQPLWQSQTNTPYSSFLSPQTKSASGARMSTNTGTSHKQSQMILQEKLPQDQKENKATLLLETFNQIANTDRNSNINGNKQQLLTQQDNQVYSNNGHSYNNSASVIGNTYGFTSNNNNNNNSGGSQVPVNSSSNSKLQNGFQQQQLQTQQVLGIQGMSSNSSNMHGKNSKSVQMKQTQPILSGYTSQQQLHVKNSNSLSSATKQQQQQQQQQTVKVQNNNYFLSNGAATGPSHNSSNSYNNATANQLNVINSTTNNPLSTSSSQPNINNPANIYSNINSNSNTAKMLLQQQQQQKKQQNSMSLSTSHAQQQQFMQQSQSQSSAGLRMRTEERERTYEDYESMFAFQPQQGQQQIQNSQQSSNLLASSHQLKKLAAARSHFNLNSNGNNQYANNSNSMIKGAQDLKRPSGTATNAASAKSLQQFQKGALQLNSNNSNNPSSSMNGFNYNNNGNNNNINTNSQQDYQQGLTHNINNNNNNYFASSLYASSGVQQQPNQATFNPSSSEQQQPQQYQSNQVLGSYGGYISNRSSWNPSTASTGKNAQTIPTSKINNLNGSTSNSNNNGAANNQQLSSRHMTSPRTGSVGLASGSKNTGSVPAAIGQIASSKVYNPLGYI